MQENFILRDSMICDYLDRLLALYLSRHTKNRISRVCHFVNEHSVQLLWTMLGGSFVALPASTGAGPIRLCQHRVRGAAKGLT
jgi:hypothetical protein